MFLALCAALSSACDSARHAASSSPASVTANAEPVVTTLEANRTEPAPSQRVPVVVELFSSEGCSSCPPADEALRALDEEQPVDGALVIPLELHVDYWNDLGWADPFSSSEFSSRQQAYSARAGRRGVFTPEAIVDGHGSIVGSNREGLAGLVRDAAKAKHVAVQIQIADDKATVTVSDDPPKGSALWLAVTDVGLETHVAAGENRGRTLRHGPVVRRLLRVGDASRGTAVVDLGKHIEAEKSRAVVFLAANDGSIVGAATAER